MKKVARVVLCLLVLSPTISGAADRVLPQELLTAIKKTGFDTQGMGLFIQSVDSTEPLVLLHADQAFNPASVVKLVTTVASLGVLGPDYRWNTDVSYSGKIEGHTLKGDLYFQGYGDPYLTPERFWRLLNRVSIYGIRNVAGNVYIDSSYFLPGEINYGAFDDQPYRTYNVGPSALLVGFQATEFHFSVSDKKVLITPFPASPKLQIVNKVKLVKGACGAWQKRLSLDASMQRGLVQVIFTGRYAVACDRRTLYRRVTQAQDHFRHFFLPLWQQLGGTVSGKIAHSVVPANTRLALQDSSISLGETIRLINKFSNNVMTRQVLLSLGAQTFGPPGTTEKGIKAIKNWLTGQGFNDPVLQLDNGAGLSRDTRISAALLGKLLHFTFHQAYMPEFVASLPVSGYDGTMAHRFKGEPISGHAHIKTGLLDFVQTMAGYVTTAKGKRYVVVLLQNHPRAHTQMGEQLQNTIIRWVYNLDS